MEDDVVECTTEVEEECEDETSGYTTNTKGSKWPREVSSVSKKQVKKYTPISGCTKKPRELCAPTGCGLKQGTEEYYDRVRTVVQDAPNEQCTLEPQRTCKHVIKMLPKLEPTEECVGVPEEMYINQAINIAKVRCDHRVENQSFNVASTVTESLLLKARSLHSRRGKCLLHDKAFCCFLGAVVDPREGRPHLQTNARQQISSVPDSFQHSTSTPQPEETPTFWNPHLNIYQHLIFYSKIPFHILFVSYEFKLIGKIY